MRKQLLALLLALILSLCAPAAAESRQLPDLDSLPETTDAGFLPEGEDPVYYKDHKGGRWFFLSDTVRVEIVRSQTRNPLMTWYMADIQCREGTTMYTRAWNTERPGRTEGLPQAIAQRERAAFAMSADFYSYRMKHDRYSGVIIRDGAALKGIKNYSKKAVTAVPNLDTFAFYPDGAAEVNIAYQVSAKEYLSRGADTVLAFGPVLLKDGEAPDLSASDYSHLEPRCCIGYVSRGHFIALLVEGRSRHSDGADLAACQQLLLEAGCTDALNLDGGNTVAMLFMGESVMLSENGGVYENDRSIPDILCAGTY